MNGNALTFMYSWHANIVYNLIYGDMMFQLSQPSENESICDARRPITRLRLPRCQRPAKKRDYFLRNDTGRIRCISLVLVGDSLPRSQFVSGLRYKYF